MKKFLLLEKNERVIEILKPALEEEFKVDVVVYSETSGLSDVIKTPVDFDLILARSFFEDDQGIFEFTKSAFNALYDIQAKTPLISFGEVDITYESFKALPERFKVNQLFLAIKELLNLSTKEMKQVKLADFVPVPLSNFYLMNSCCCDVFIKLTKNGKEHYVKRINEGEGFDKDVIKKYESMKLESFFVRKEDHEDFLNQLLTQSVQKVYSAQETDQHMDVLGDSYEISKNLIEDLGVTKQVVEMANASIDSMVTNIEGSKFGDLLKDILKNKNSFCYKRSYLIALFSSQIIPLLDWGQGESQNKVNFEKLVFVSFFHDILLKEEKLLRIMSEKQLKEADLPSAKRNLVLEHANMIATMIQSFPKAPAGVDVIIRQHHGIPNGIGFSKYPSTNISPMAIAFIVLEDFVTEILIQMEEGKINISSIFRHLEEKYTLSLYAKVVQALRKVIKK